MRPSLSILPSAARIPAHPAPRRLARWLPHAYPHSHAHAPGRRPLLTSAEAAAKSPAEAVAVAQEAKTAAPGLPPQIRLFIVGSPGSGKGTLSARLQSKLGDRLSIITAGDLLRHHISAGTPLGRQAAAVIQQGELMPDQTMADLVQSELNAIGGHTSWMLDGFPRTLPQARLLDKSLAVSGQPINMIISLNVPPSVILDRIKDRWVHIPSGRVYNISFNPPQVPGLDDITGEPLSKRPDDTPEVFGKRLDTFHEMTEPILAHYAQQAATTLTNEDIAAPPGSSPEQQRALGLTLRQELSAVPLDRAVQVTLSGTSSNAIWPLLERVVDARFQRDRPVNQGQAQAQAQAAPDPPCSPDPPRQPHREKIAPGS